MTLLNRKGEEKKTKLTIDENLTDICELVSGIDFVNGYKNCSLLIGHLQKTPMASQIILGPAGKLSLFKIPSQLYFITIACTNVTICIIYQKCAVTTTEYVKMLLTSTSPCIRVMLFFYIFPPCPVCFHKRCTNLVPLHVALLNDSCINVCSVWCWCCFHEVTSFSTKEYHVVLSSTAWNSYGYKERIIPSKRLWIITTLMCFCQKRYLLNEDEIRIWNSVCRKYNI